MTKQFCPCCGVDAEHRERRKQKPYPQTHCGQFRGFLNGFFSGVSGHDIAGLE
ncbi:hypothetical protein [Aeromonas sp. HMWF014]|uniref:hypothetical protein n=1 Tax=Aeromonas sp. HMWF014 TaxID=2056850 RepID=UPI0015E80CFE|nr:hypothetical protein [Aeromonas sp. HMWF014]